MGRTYDAITRAERQRKPLPRSGPPEGVPGGWETLQNDRVLSRWRRWVARPEAQAPPEGAQTPLETALVEQIASLEFAVGALDDQLSRELPEMERRLLDQYREELRQLDERLSSRISAAAEAAVQKLSRRSRRISILLSIALVVLLAILFRL